MRAHDEVLRSAVDDLLDINRQFKLTLEPGLDQRGRMVVLICMAYALTVRQGWLIKPILKLAVRFS